MKPLTNERWGFRSNCFVCEPTNGAGLRIPFFHDETTDSVVADLQLDDRFSGAPTYVHGGVLLAVLDEAMAWAGIAIGASWAVTGETTTRFERPVVVGKPHRVTARIDGEERGTKLFAEAEITDAEGARCATATATLIVLGEAQLAEAAGVGIDDLDEGPRRPA